VLQRLCSFGADWGMIISGDWVGIWKEVVPLQFTWKDSGKPCKL